MDDFITGLLGNEVFGKLLLQILAAAAAGLATMLTALIVRILKQRGIEVTKEQEQLVAQISTQIVHYVEEWAASLIKRGVGPGERGLVNGGTWMSSAAKLEHAKELLKVKFPKMTDQQAEVAILAALATNGLGASTKPALDQPQPKNPKADIPKKAVRRPRGRR